MAFTFREKKYTVGLTVEGFTNRSGNRPNNDDMVEFMRKDLGADISQLMQIQWNDILNLRTCFLTFATDEAASAFEDKVAGESAVKGGVPWTACNSKRLGGWRCDGITLVVKVMYVSYEVPLLQVKEVLSTYGVVKDISHSHIRIPGVKHLVQDGVIMARVTLHPDFRELPCWIRRRQTDTTPAEIWRLQHRGQRMPGCWNCGNLYHIGKRCKVPLQGFIEEETNLPSPNTRNQTFSQALKNNSSPQPQGGQSGGVSANGKGPGVSGVGKGGDVSVQGKGGGVSGVGEGGTSCKDSSTPTVGGVTSLEQGSGGTQPPVRTGLSPSQPHTRMTTKALEAAAARLRQQAAKVTEVTSQLETPVDDIQVLETSEVGVKVNTEVLEESKVLDEAMEVDDELNVDNDVIQVQERVQDGSHSGKEEVQANVEGVAGQEEVLFEAPVEVGDTGGSGDIKGGEVVTGGDTKVDPGGCIKEDTGGGTKGDTSGQMDGTISGTQVDSNLEICLVETVDTSDLPQSQVSVGRTDPVVESGAVLEGGPLTAGCGTVPDGSHQTVLDGSQVGAASGGSLQPALQGSIVDRSQDTQGSSGQSLPCGQGSLTAQAGNVTPEDMKLLFVGELQQLQENFGGLQQLKENFGGLTQTPHSPDFLPKEIKEEKDVVVTRQEAAGNDGSSLSGGLPLGQGSAKGVSSQTGSAPPIIMISSGSEHEEEVDDKGVKRKKKKDANDKSSKLQHGDPQ